MPTWKVINDANQSYQDNKGVFRKLFLSKSKFMNFIYNYQKDKSDILQLTLKDIFTLIVRVMEIPENLHSNLSYQLAIGIIKSCTNDDSLSVFNAFIYLKTINNFNLTAFNNIFAYPDAIAISNILLACNSQNNLAHLTKLTTRTNLNLEHFIGELLEISQDFDSALIWYDKSSKNNYADSTLRSGEICEDKNNYKLAAKYYITAIRQGHSLALRALECLLKKQYDAQAAYYLSEFYYFAYGCNSLTITSFLNVLKSQDQEALLQIKKLTESRPDLAYKVGNFYDQDNDTQDVNLAILFYKQATKQKHLLASLRLGEIYQNINHSKSITLYKSTAKAESEHAQIFLDTLQAHKNKKNRSTNTNVQLIQSFGS